MPLRFNQLVRSKKYKASLKINIKKVVQSIMSHKAHCRILNPGESNKGKISRIHFKKCQYSIACFLSWWSVFYGFWVVVAKTRKMQHFSNLMTSFHRNNSPLTLFSLTGSIKHPQRPGQPRPRTAQSCALIKSCLVLI